MTRLVILLTLTLLVAAVAAGTEHSWRVSVETSSEWGAGTQKAILAIKLMGEYNTSKWIRLTNNHGLVNFNSGSTNHFDFTTTRHLGKINSIKLRYGSWGWWHCERVSVTDLMSSTRSFYPTMFCGFPWFKKPLTYEAHAVENSCKVLCGPTPSSLPREMATLPSGVEVLCDTVTEGGGWVVFQRRASAAVDFYDRNWADYTEGFGDLSPNGNFWLGLETIHELCGSASDKCMLRMDLKYNNTDYYAEYGSFYISDSSDNYRLYVYNYSGTTTDVMISHAQPANRMPFTTLDRDNDPYEYDNCAVFNHGGWWFNKCTMGYVNGRWYNGITERGLKGKGLVWWPLTEGHPGVLFSEMKLKKS